MAKQKKTTTTTQGRDSERMATALSTSSAPSTLPPPSFSSSAPGTAAAHTKQAQTEASAAARPHNAEKASEHGTGGAQQGSTTKPPSPPLATASTLSESQTNTKTTSMDARRANDSGQALTTNQGVAVADNQNSLKAGLRGPTLLEDFILREKLTHFDHERIPERVVHARGSAAHGVFECTADITRFTKAAPFARVGKRTPVFTRFSTVAGERGSADTARDARGFAVKFYSDAGNWDLVGNNIPVFFIQDAMKFPDLVHAVKPEPHHGMPQAASAHDTFWDFVSLMPESAHMLQWVMSDRAIPRSYRTMQGFGVHTFRLVNDDGASVFCKFHWTPVLGTHSLVWDEAAKIAGADADFHRRDLWEAIEAGDFPVWELGLQIFTEEQADRFSFDVLDATKLIPEELVPVQVVGRMTLDRNPDNFFAETEQVAFCTAHVIPGIDFSNDPLLAGRIHSYVDTQITRLGGANFHEIPINAPVVDVHNNQRDGLHRQAIPRGRVSYEPNSLGGGCPFQTGAPGRSSLPPAKLGFTSVPETIRDDKVRGKPEKFADHYTQATLFYRSQSPVEQAHIAGAFRFELTKVQTQAIRERVVALLRNVDEDLAATVADGLGFESLPAPLPKASTKKVKPEVETSPALSLLARPGNGGARGRRIALVVGDGVDVAAVRAVHRALAAAFAVPRFVGARLGKVHGSDGDVLHVEVSVEAAPAVLFDACIVAAAAAGDDAVVDFVKEQHKHCKVVWLMGAAAAIADVAHLSPTLPNGDADPGFFVGGGNVEAFVKAVAGHRVFARDPDAPHDVTAT